MFNSWLFRCTTIAALTFLFQGCSNEQMEDLLLIEDVTIIDAQNGQRQHMNVFIQQNKIVKLLAVGEKNQPKASTIVNGSGKYLIPGLWDTHVHLAYNADLSPVMFDLFLLHGITSIRDTGGALDIVLPLKKIAENNPKNTPRVKITGPLLDGVPTVYNGKGQLPKLGVGLPTIAAAKRQVNALHEAGVDVLKLYEMLSPEVFQALIQQADSLQIPVTGHVPLSLDVIAASEAGMRSMEHLRNLEFAFAKNWDSLLTTRKQMLLAPKGITGMKLRAAIHSAQRTYALSHEDSVRKEKVLASFRKNETWQVPTLTIMTVASLRFFGTTEWKETFELLPDTVGNAWSYRLEKYLSTPKNLNYDHYSEWMLGMIKTLKEADVNLMAGTDTPIFFLTPGHSLHEELALLVQGGLTPMEALDAATLQPARYFNLQHELGSIAENKLADLVLLNANPLEDIRNTSRIHAVIRDGNLHDRAALDSLRQKLKKSNY